MMISFVIAGFVCAVAALCYSELASMVPVAGSAYTYTYAVVGEIFAWMVGWALILEYAVGASAVAVGWSGYFVGLLRSSFGIEMPMVLSVGPSPGRSYQCSRSHSRGFCDWTSHRRHHRKRAFQCGSGSNQGDGPHDLHRPHAPARKSRLLSSLHPERLGHDRCCRRGVLDLLCLCRIRRGLDSGGRNAQSAAQCPDRIDREPSHLHGVLSPRRSRRSRRHRRAAGARVGR